MKNCEVCKTLEDLIEELWPNKILYGATVPVANAVERALEKHKKRAHKEEEK